MNADRHVWPNFFIAGVAKAGTTALYHYLRQHPQIYMSSLKEPCFFAAADLDRAHVLDEIAANSARNRPVLEALLGGPERAAGTFAFALEEDRYLELFREVRSEIAIGEASVPYFYLPSAAGAIAARVPHARLVFILRDPAERMFSQYLASHQDERPQSFRTRFLAALDSRDSMAWWLDSGRYATHLSRFLEHFPRAQIRVYLYENYVADPHGMLRDIFAFLGVDREFRPDTSLRHNEPSIARSPLLHFLQRRAFGTALARCVPDALRPTIRAIYYRRPADIRLDADDRGMVIEHFRDEIERTADIIGGDLSAWLR